ncbi:hypothetical protein CEXT_553151 [Caerostris extrusa]|uniref:Secreted protein n=1 Tax=Caerostris extrusa TaxID=172846 RepID=A0AAV4XJ45_CAEEX|nr:hypothetical protein CEXT_553151 [Caerostris extrusa]
MKSFLSLSFSPLTVFPLPSSLPSLSLSIFSLSLLLCPPPRGSRKRIRTHIPHKMPCLLVILDFRQQNLDAMKTGTLDNNESATFCGKGS